MALRLACNRLAKHISCSPAAAGRTGRNMALRSFATAGSEESASALGGTTPSVFDKIISLTIVDPSGARRKINGMVGEFILVFMLRYRPFFCHCRLLLTILIKIIDASFFILLLLYFYQVNRSTRHARPMKSNLVR
ncbi:MAG: hypothetical protein ACI90V_003669 [Bacillariaceae sp.]|jgi:hypothetical protein